MMQVKNHLKILIKNPTRIFWKITNFLGGFLKNELKNHIQERKKNIFDQNWWRFYFKNRDLGHPSQKLVPKNEKFVDSPRTY